MALTQTAIGIILLFGSLTTKLATPAIVLYTIRIQYTLYIIQYYIVPAQVGKNARCIT